VKVKNIIEAKKGEIEEKLIEFIADNLARGDRYTAFFAAKRLASLKLDQYDALLRVPTLIAPGINSYYDEVPLGTSDNIRVAGVAFAAFTLDLCVVIEAGEKRLSIELELGRSADEDAIERLANEIINSERVKRLAEKLREKYEIERLEKEIARERDRASGLSWYIAELEEELSGLVKRLERIERYHTATMKFIEAAGLRDEFEQYRKEVLEILESEDEEE